MEWGLKEIILSQNNIDILLLSHVNTWTFIPLHMFRVSILYKEALCKIVLGKSAFSCIKRKNSLVLKRNRNNVLLLTIQNRTKKSLWRLLVCSSIKEKKKRNNMRHLIYSRRPRPTKSRLLWVALKCVQEFFLF